MNINNNYSTEIELVELKILIFESEYKKANKENIIIKNYFKKLILTNSLYIKNLIYNSYELEIVNIYKFIENLENQNVELCKEFNALNSLLYINRHDYNLSDKFTEELEENIIKSDNNDKSINHYKKTINKLKKDREESLSKWKQKYTTY